MIGALWLVFLVGAGLVLWLGVAPAWDNPRGDFANYYTAAQLVAEDQPLWQAYRDFVWFQKQIDRLGISQQLGGFIPHPPPTALVMLPLTPLSPLAAKRVWLVFNLLLAAACVRWLARLTGLSWLMAACVFLGTGFGLVNNFLFGQMYLLLLASVIGGLLLQQRGHPWLAGLALGTMLPVKYFGAFFVLYFAWQRQWRVVFGAALMSVALIGLTAALQGGEIFPVYLREVLPRHLQGEIQDPFALQFQSWHSLLRRMFVADPSLNPHPPVASALLFQIGKHVIPWLWLAGFYWIYRETAFTVPSHQRLFEMGFLPVAALLISPGSATYHFLLLSLSAASFVAILLACREVRRAALLAGLFFALNLPHYLLLQKYASGWFTPLGYMRLWLLVVFLLAVLWSFHRLAGWRWQPASVRRVFLPALTIAAALVAIDHVRAAHRTTDAAQWLPLHEKEFDRHLGLLVKTPDLGCDRMVFSYGELRDENFAIFAMSTAGHVEGQWTPETAVKFYEPDLGGDDQRLLVETLHQGRAEIWLSEGRGQLPRFLLAGGNPTWHRDHLRLAFVREGRIGLAEAAATTATEFTVLAEPQGCFDLSFSPSDDRLAFCSKQEALYELGVFNVATGAVEVLLQSATLLERPAWSPAAKMIVFSWSRDANRDLWALELSTRELRRLTFDPAIDTAPVWEGSHSRIIFASDRGRGLECSTLYWIPAPPECE